MGALHEGHLSLVKLAKKSCERVVVSIFVNPEQFAEGEDMETYPRDEKSDLGKLSDCDCDLVYTPQLEDMYPQGSVTNVRVEELSDRLEGLHRPHFFYGVTTVVARLFIHAQPDVAVFGEKDFQQLQIIRRMTIDLGFNTKIIGAPTIRSSNGLALSSRNAYLSDQERSKAIEMYNTLAAAKQGIEAGKPINEIVDEAVENLAAHGFGPIDYVEAIDSHTLLPLDKSGQQGRLVTAAWLGKTRLIDNLELTIN